VLDKLDILALRELERDGRLSYAALGERIGLSKSPCWKRVAGLEESGAIQGYRAVLDPAALGLTITAFVRATVAFAEHQRFEDATGDYPCIMACFATVGDTDYLLHVVTRSMDSLDDFLRNQLWRLPGVERFSTTISTRSVKTNGLLSEIP
jgi:Lrp/AsnC family transcriptional regulator, leucine-responsive regulatory protein